MLLHITFPDLVIWMHQRTYSRWLSGFPHARPRCLWEYLAQHGPEPRSAQEWRDLAYESLIRRGSSKVFDFLPSGHWSEKPVANVEALLRTLSCFVYRVLTFQGITSTVCPNGDDIIVRAYVVEEQNARITLQVQDALHCALQSFNILCQMYTTEHKPFHTSVRELPEAQRDLVQYVLSGASAAAAGRKYGISASAATGRLNRARARLGASWLAAARAMVAEKDMTLQPATVLQGLPMGVSERGWLRWFQKQVRAGKITVTWA